MSSLFQTTPGEAPSALARELAAVVPANHWDALRARCADGQAGGALAPEWTRFFDLLGPEGFDSLDPREQRLRQQIREDGASYNVHADASQPNRAWSVDLFPFIVDAASWEQIAGGIAQRAALLDAVLHDVYCGPQRTLREGLLPMALVQGHPGYLRAMHGHRPPGGVWLHVAAFDLARAPDGSWQVVNQRLQAPSGLGYLLENRLLVSRLFPEAFSALRVQRLAASYRTLLQTVQALAPAEGHPPRVVLLTPGPYTETYFEQVYLASYLGITLAEGNDLTVRGEALYLKTMRGLEPVHAVLRRLDDAFCDPLELRPDSMLGIPGLLQAVRAGKVLLANALGAGFLESAALQGFLPRLCEALLGEALRLPALPSWWCGEAGACDAALRQLGEWVVKPVHSDSGFEPAVMAGLDPEQLQAWRERVLADPEQATLQRYLPLPQVPVWNDGRMAARAAMLRVYALADGRGGWRVLPGGLARTARRGGNVVSMQRGGSSQDAWVITGETVDDSTLLPAPMRPQDLLGRHRVVTSRAAENLFWIGRYTERAEHSVRLARLTLRALSGDDELGPRVAAMLEAWCREAGLVDAGTPGPGADAQAFERALVRGLQDAGREGGVVHALQSLGRAAAPVRDRLAPDHRQWIEAAAQLRLPGASRHEDWGATQLQHGLERITEILSAITGAQTDRMTRDDGWRLLSIGRHVERLGRLAGALHAAFASGGVQHDSGYALVLGLFDSLITFRALHQRRQEVPPLLDLLVLDPENPRSLAWVAQTLRSRLAKLPDLGETGTGRRDDLTALAPDPREWNLSDLCTHAPDGRHAWLEQSLRATAQAAWRVSDEVSRRYFVLADAPVRFFGGY